MFNVVAFGGVRWRSVGDNDANDDYYTNDQDRKADDTGANDLHDIDTTIYTFGDLKNAILATEIVNLENILEQNPTLVR